MDLAALVRLAAQRGASDLHLAVGQPVVLRVGGELCLLDGGPPLAAADTEAAARALLGAEGWQHLQQQGSADRSLALAGVRCRVNVLRSVAGLGLALRLLPGGAVTLESLNLHPALAELVEAPHGLLLVCGPTGSGKSSTLAALVQQVNRTRSRHVVTLEHPVEFELRPERAFIRQREVGRDTPSFAQGLLDAMREDIDVLAVGEMRERETMRLTLDACETGHLVLATLHSATAAEALQRIVSAFPASEQPSVGAQLADVLVAVVAQRLVWHDPAGQRLPQAEVLRGSSAVKAVLRQGQFFKLGQLMETGARSGMWTFERWREWQAGRGEWVHPPQPASEPERAVPASPSGRPAAERPGSDRPVRPADPAPPAAPGDDEPRVIVIEPPSGSVADILRELD